MEYCKNRQRYKDGLSYIPFKFLAALLLFHCARAMGQSCPPNIDFESGTFSGWTCYTGFVSAVGDQNVISVTPAGGPVSGRQTMYSSGNHELDPYGGFPVLCPNGSGHSIKLGNTRGGGQAEAISYEFTIPPDDDSYSLVYNYAVVFQSPNHRPNEQPRMEIEAINVTDNKVITCASSTFIALGSSLSGFRVSTLIDTITVLYKDWSSVSVDLSGNAGKTIRLIFKTADCTFRRHFGYAYIDVNSECGGNLIGAAYCPDDTVLHVSAPFGFQSYTWYDSSLTDVLGTQQVLTLSPVPASGTTVAVKLNPYLGFGCPKTMFAHLRDTLTVTANAGRDTLSCNEDPVQIGTISKMGLAYAWSPAAGLTNANIANPFAAPKVTTSYVVTTSSAGGGCRIRDTVLVRASSIDTVLHLTGKAMFCAGYGDSAILTVQQNQDIQWYQDGLPIGGERGTIYRVERSGIYYALLSNAAGCTVPTQKQPVIIDIAKPGITYPVEYAIIDLPFTLHAREIGENVLWEPATSLNTPTSFSPVFNGDKEQLYTISISTNTGCLTTDTQLVKTVKHVEIYVPTAFTPNNDRTNDILSPILRGVKEINYFRVFNRQGQLVFEGRNEESGWDGSFKGVQQSTQVVVWMLSCVGLDGVVYTRKGTSILLR